MTRQCNDLEGAILFIVGFVYGGSHAEDWMGWQTEVLRLADRLTRQDLQCAFLKLAEDGLIDLTNQDNQPYSSDQSHFFAGLFRATLTLEGARYFRSLRITTQGGRVHVAAAA